MHQKRPRMTNVEFQHFKFLTIIMEIRSASAKKRKRQRAGIQSLCESFSNFDGGFKAIHSSILKKAQTLKPS